MKLILMLQDKNLLIRSILCNYITSQHLLLEEVLPKSYFTSTMLQSCNLSKFVFGNSQYSSLDRMYVVTVKKSKIIILYMFFLYEQKSTQLSVSKPFPAIFKKLPTHFSNSVFSLWPTCLESVNTPFEYLRKMKTILVQKTHN